MGHTTSLLVAGVLVIGLGVAIPEPVADILELAVALMIVFLGVRLLRLHIHPHTHGGSTHIHLHFQNEQHAGHAHSGLAGWRPFLVGIVHGLAGSAALTLLVLSEVVKNGSALFGFAYLLIFGVGSIGGMLLMSGLIGLPFSFGLRFFKRTLFPMRLATGIMSTSFGVFYAWRVVEKLSMG
jgi:sulfite exporter TauE/SafE